MSRRSVACAFVLASTVLATHNAFARACTDDEPCQPPGGSPTPAPSATPKPFYPDMFWIGDVPSANALRYGNIAGWPLSSNWNRYAVINTAIAQIYAYTGGGSDGATGLYGTDAVDVYGVDLFGNKWCSEFAAWVFSHSGGTDPDLSSVHTVADFQYDIFNLNGSWIERNIFNPRYPAQSIEPGDYLALHNSDGDFKHSAVVVGVADDMSRIWTVEGNLHLSSGDAGWVHFQERPYINGGQLNPDINAIGKTSYILPSQPLLAATSIGSPSGYVRIEDGAEMVLVQGADNHLYEYSHGGVNDLSTLSGPLLAGDPFGYVRSDYHSAVVYRGVDGGIYEFSLHYPYWQMTSLSGAVGGAPAAIGDPTALNCASGGSIVVYRSAANHIYALEYLANTWVGHDLNAEMGLSTSADAGGDPSMYIRTDNRNAIVYRATNGHIYEISFADLLFGGWQMSDLTQSSGAPIAAGDPSGSVLPNPGNTQTNCVAYGGMDDHIYEMCAMAPPSAWQWADLTTATAGGSAPLAAGDPFLTVRSDGHATVSYRAKTNIPFNGGIVSTTFRIVELSLYDYTWYNSGLSVANHLPPSMGDLRPYRRASGVTAIPYLSTRGNVYELTLVNNGWWSLGKL